MRALTLLSMLFGAACATTRADPQAAKADAREALLQTDRAMSALSARSGMGAAFASMFEADAVSLHNGTMPLKSRDAIVASTVRCAAACENTWEPLSAEADGELGYTWGTYVLTHTTPGEAPQTTTGSYVTVWKHDKKGSWHAVLTSATRDE